MDSLILQPTSTAQWHMLVNEAIYASGVHLSEDLESYLVFLLMRYTKKNHLASSVLALEYLESQQNTGKRRQIALRDVGDKCLLFSGLFPGLALNRRVRVSYFVKLGQSAYWVLSDLADNGLSPLYHALCEDFVALMDVLHTFRSFDKNAQILSPLDALELWTETGSASALARVQEEVSDNGLIITTSPGKLIH